MVPKRISFKRPANGFGELRDRTRLVQWLAAVHARMWGRGAETECWNFSKIDKEPE